MKYASLKVKKSEQYKIPALDGGIDTSKYDGLIPDNCFCDCKNIWNKKGTLTNRPAILPNSDSVVDLLYSGYGDFIKGLTLTDTLVYIDGNPKKIGYCVEGDNVSYNIFRPYLVDSNGNLTEMGNIEFHRVTQDLYNRFESVFFMVANATVGSGIYAFITRRNEDVYPNEYLYSIYEASSDLSSWQRLYDDDFYVPTVFMNGRGNNFDYQIESLNAYLEEPVELEPFNMLTGRFKAYFSSDGYSTTFELPFGELDTQGVMCRVYTTSQTYTDFIVDVTTDNAMGYILGYYVKFKINRSTGTFSFYFNDELFSVPKMGSYGGNNIQITTSKTIENGTAKTIGSKGVVLYGNNIYLYGNSICGNEIYTSSITRPLYIPEKSMVAVGEPSSSVNAMTVVCNKLVAFKDSEIYRIILTKGTAYDVSEFAMNINNTFMKIDTLSCEAVHLQVGCDCPDTLKVCSNRVIWTRSDGSVYTLATTTYGKENNIYKISSAIDGIFENISKEDLRKAKACERDGFYLLHIDNKVLVVDYRIKDFGFPAKYSGQKDNSSNIAWYVWEYPENFNYSSVISLTGEVLLTCYDSLADVWYISLLNGDKDYLLNGRELQPYDIECSFKTKYYDFSNPHIHKVIKNMYITECSGGRAELTIDNGVDGISYTKTLDLPFPTDVLKTDMNLSDIKRVALSFKTCKPFKLYGLIFEYLNKAV